MIQNTRGHGEEVEQSKKIQDYLSERNPKELFEIAAEFGEQGHLDQSGLLLSPYFKKMWNENNISPNDVCNIILDKSYNRIFRMFILDSFNHSEKMKGAELNEGINTMLTIAQDNTESAEIRRFALLNLCKPGSYAKQNDLNQDLKSELLQIFNDKTAPPAVRGAVLTAMRRTKDPNFENTINTIFSKYSAYPEITLRYAAIEAAKSKLNKDTYSRYLITMINETDNPELYSRLIYSLGIIGGTDAVKTIESNYERFNETRICRSALQKNYKTILSMLNLEKPKATILSGINAAKIGSISPAIESLLQIIENSNDQEIIAEAKDALNYVKANPSSDNYYKWEDD